MFMEKGNLSINSDNILPIIKKWLYSDIDIFIRELVSNATDAITKLKVIQDEDKKYEIRVILDKENSIIKVTDNGIGMTADEIKKYINEIAFSGANEFLSNYADKASAQNEIIGHFGLGFYSTFMVADKVQIDSLSYMENATPARWICDGGVEYEMSESDKSTVGTTITLYVGEHGKEFLDEYKIRSILKKYCSFMPIEIYLETVKTQEQLEKEAKDKPAEAEENVEPEVEYPINDPNPLWLKQAKDCTDEEYKEFYNKVFMDFNEPLFWIHLNMDYPFRLKGILYFPKLKHELESIEGQVKLFNNQVFIADNIKEVIPEFLLLLKGTLDCPDLPLNVSRSFLQNDQYVAKLSGYITKKVADKLNSLFSKDRENFNKYWDDIAPFIKYGCIKDKDFYEKIKDSILFKTTANDHVTLSEFLERNKEKTQNTVYYVSNEQQQAHYISMFKDNELEAVILSTNLDNPFISYLESYESSGKAVKFNRIDSDISEALKDKEDSTIESEQMQELFRTVLSKDKLNVKVESLKSNKVSAIMLLSEQSRRMSEMSKMFGSMPNMFESEESLVLNSKNSLVQSLHKIKDNPERLDDIKLICEQVYDLAMISHKPLDADAMTNFMERSNLILERLANI